MSDSPDSGRLRESYLNARGCSSTAGSACFSPIIAVRSGSGADGSGRVSNSARGVSSLECNFSNPALGDGFREGKPRWNRVSGQVSCFFLSCYRNPIVDFWLRWYELHVETRAAGLDEIPEEVALN